MLNQKRAGTLLSYVQLMLNVLIGIIYTPILLRYLGSSEYGVYSVATAVISFLTMLDLGFGQSRIDDLAPVPAPGCAGGGFQPLLGGVVNGVAGAGPAVAALDAERPAAFFTQHAGAAAEGAVQQLDFFQYIHISVTNKKFLEYAN